MGLSVSQRVENSPWPRTFGPTAKVPNGHCPLTCNGGNQHAIDERIIRGFSVATGMAAIPTREGSRWTVGNGIGRGPAESDTHHTSAHGPSVFHSVRPNAPPERDEARIGRIRLLRSLREAGHDSHAVMCPASRDPATEIRRGWSRRRIPRAPGAQAYMKSRDPFLGFRRRCGGASSMRFSPGGGILERDRSVTSRVAAWRDSPTMWMRRASLLAHLRHGAATDLPVFRGTLEAVLPEGGFFTPKAVGWALRQHARTGPDRVRAFVDGREDRMRPSSRTETLRPIRSGGWLRIVDCGASQRRPPARITRVAGGRRRPRRAGRR